LLKETDMEDREEKKGFTIRDRRVSSQPEGTAQPESGSGPTVTEGAERSAAGRKGESPSSDSLPEIDFSSFIFSLSTSALFHLGEVPDPVTQQREKNLLLAKQTIDILGMLREKTKGNLTADEEKVMDHLLADLRLRFVRESK
jgi:hypothetical protein